MGKLTKLVSIGIGIGAFSNIPTSSISITRHLPSAFISSPSSSIIPLACPPPSLISGLARRWIDSRRQGPPERMFNDRMRNASVVQPLPKFSPVWFIPSPCLWRHQTTRERRGWTKQASKGQSSEPEPLLILVQHLSLFLCPSVSGTGLPPSLLVHISIHKGQRQRRHRFLGSRIMIPGIWTSLILPRQRISRSLWDISCIAKGSPKSGPQVWWILFLLSWGSPWGSEFQSL